MTVEHGMLIVIVLSALFVPLWCALRSRVFRFVMATVFPFVVSVGLYWMPNLTRLHNAELRVWAGLVVAIWFVPAVLVSVALTFLIGLLRRR
jgi:hypothetical protein